MVERIDPDYDPSEREVEHLARLLSLVAGRVGSLHVSESNGKNGVFQKWLLTAVMLIFVAGVTALAGVEYSVVQRLSVLETKVDILLVRK